MALVKLSVNGREYAVGCADGEEARIRELGAYLDSVVRRLSARVAAGPAVTDSHLLVLAGLTIADELADTRDRLDASAPAARAGTADAAGREETAHALDWMAARLETVAANLEKL